jgi:3-oxoacyl-[acyl-carrier protein] reductase
LDSAIKHLGNGGSINMGSGVSRITPVNSSVYTGSKVALDALTGVWAREFGPRKIRVNSINSGMIDTEGAHSGGMIGSDIEKTAYRSGAARPNRAGSRHQPNRCFSRVR